MDKAWGLSATQWAAIAAMGSLVAALVAAVTTGWTLMAQGGRPKVSLRFGALDEGRLTTWSHASKTPDSTDGALDVVVVTVQNAGRTPFTCLTPEFEHRRNFCRSLQLFRDLARRRHTSTVKPVPFQDSVLHDKVRVEPHDQVIWVLPLTAYLKNFDPLRPHSRDWDYLRVRVLIAGRRPKLVLKRIPANPKKVQLNGQPLTLLGFMRRWALVRRFEWEQYLAVHPEGADTAPPEPPTNAVISSVYMGLNAIGSSATKQTLNEAFAKYAPPHDPTKWALDAWSLGERLEAAGLLASEENADADRHG